MNQEKKAIRTFLIAVILISVCLEGRIIYTGNMALAAILMWIPGCTALVCYLSFKLKDEIGLLFHKCKIRYIVEGIALPFVYIGVSYVIYWIMHPETMKLTVDVRFFVMLIIGIPLSMVTALGEEIGWRGFLVPRLYKQVGLEKTLVFTSLLWAVWHLPLLASGVYMPGTLLGFKIPLFTIIIFSEGIMIGILTLKSKSVWPAALFHAAHNHFDQAIFGEATISNDKMYYVSETGVFTAIIVVILAIYMYKSYKKSQMQEGIAK